MVPIVKQILMTVVLITPVSMVQLALMVLQTIHALVQEALLAETVRQILMIASHPLVNTMELVWIKLMNTVAHVFQDSLGRIVTWNLMNVTVTLV